MIYVDPPFDPRPHARPGTPFARTARAAHLSADTLAELRAYLAARRFPPSYLHRPGGPDFHYDLHGPWLAIVIRDPRIKRVSRRGYVELLQAKRFRAERRNR
jgi:hypothetical protein